MAEPFVKWLQEADTEESDSGEDSDGGDSDDEVQIEYDDRAKVTPLKEAAKATPAAAPPKKVAEEDEADDFDIDAI